MSTHNMWRTSKKRSRAVVLAAAATALVAALLIQACASGPAGNAAGGAGSQPAVASGSAASASTKAASSSTKAAIAPQLPERIGASPGFYSDMSARLAAFLHDLEKQIESADWSWIRDHTEHSYYRTLVTNLHMGTDEYLRYLFRVGMDYKGRFPYPAPPNQFFPVTLTWDVQYIASRSDGFVTTVYGYLYDREGHKLDFAVDVLDRIEPILLSGAYP